MSIRVYIDGKMREPDQALISVFDRGFLFGDSIFETIAVTNHRPLFLSEHLDRLERSARRIYLDPPSRTRVENAIWETIHASQEQDARIRVVVTRGVGAVDIDPASATRPSLIVIIQPVSFPSIESLEKGASVEIVNISRNTKGNLDPSVKSGNYLNSVLAVGEARRRRAGVHEAILCSPDGSITEGATSNVFLVKDGVLATPALAVGILEGVTRGKVLGLAKVAGIKACEVMSIPPEQMYQADEVFLTSAIRGILPVTSVDGRCIGTGKLGPTTRQLLEMYQRLMREA
jgi:branched-chain amino acid aminotransferase